jgi:OmpA-OmpF porin, OOP family
MGIGKAKMNRFLQRSAIPFGVMVAITGAPGIAAAQSAESRLEETTRHIEEARARQLYLIAPRAFNRAVEKLRDAENKQARGSNERDVLRDLSEADARLAEGEAVEERGRELLAGALEARAAAVAANAPEIVTTQWQEAERLMTDAGRSVESGNDDDARRKGATAEGQYRGAEFAAIRADLLGRAHQLRAAARQADANQSAAVTFAAADSVLQRAEAVLQGDRYAGEMAGALAQEASERFQHAIALAAIVDRLDDEGKAAIEALILDHESQLAQIADSLGFETSFVNGLSPVTEQILVAIHSLYLERDALRLELATRTDELDSAGSAYNVLEDRFVRLRDSLQGKLTDLEQQEQEAREILRERLRRDAALLRVQRMFSAEQAEVTSTPDELIIRLFGIQFRVGSAEIQPSNFPLLSSLQRALAEFPGSGVVVEGHTDSQGNAESNQALSQRRANAIRDHLLANMDLDPATVRAIGFGEARPIATNDTADGRARNRRIDVRIELPAVF